MISNRTACERELSRIDALVNRNATLPEQVFRVQATGYRIFEFDEIWTEQFFGFFKHLSRVTHDRGFTLAVLKPDPVDYFWAHFNQCPILQIAIEQGFDDYVQQINEDPGGSPADAIVHNSDVVLIYGESLRWAVFAARDVEIAVIATMDDVVTTALHLATVAETLHTPSAAVTKLLPSIYRRGVPEELSSRLLANYELR